MEVWKTIQGFENYEVSNLGNIKSLSRPRANGKNSSFLTKEKILKPQLDKDGYCLINIVGNNKMKTLKIHRLVAIEFLENKEKKPQVNHKNGIKSDNRLENLEWCTQSENMKHSLNTGLKIPLNGENCKVSKLTEEQVIEILTKKRDSNNKKNWGAKELCLKYNLKPTCVSEIASGRNWKHIKI